MKSENCRPQPLVFPKLWAPSPNQYQNPSSAIKPTHPHYIFFITAKKHFDLQRDLLYPFTSSNQLFFLLLIESIKKMSHMAKAWIVAASIGAVEALKDQGICRWNYTIRSIHQHAKNNLRSFSQAKKLSSSSSAMVSNRLMREEKAKQSEESLRTVMYLSCWGPN